MGIGGILGGQALGGALNGTGLHKFDTGLFRAQRTVIRESLCARLSPLLKANGGYLASIVELARPLRGEGDEDGLALLARAVNGRAPCLVVALGKKNYDGTDTESLLVAGELDIAIYAVTAHARDHVAGRLAADVVSDSNRAADPGIETMLEHVEELLLGQELGIKGVLEVRFNDEDEVATFDDYTVWEQRATIKVQRDINPRRNSTAFVTSIEGRHRLAEIPQVHPMSPTVQTVAELEEG
jgi:hypothetical protein